jgi:cold shock CspA family protein
MRGVIRQLKHLSAGSDIAATHLVSAHNGVGYGYIRTPAGDVFFDASAITNLRFDQLMRNMTVEFALDQAPYLRASRVTVVAAKGASSHFENRESELPGRL